MNGEWLNRYKSAVSDSLRASSPIWASEASLARTRERAAKPRGAEEPSTPRSRRTPRWRVLARLTQIGELPRRLGLRIQPIHLAAWVAPRNVRSGGPEDYLRTGATFERIIFLLPAEYNLILRNALRELHPWSLQIHWISLT